MKIYMVNETYNGAAKILRCVHKKAFSNREKAVEDGFDRAYPVLIFLRRNLKWK